MARRPVGSDGCQTKSGRLTTAPPSRRLCSPHDLARAGELRVDLARGQAFLQPRVLALRGVLQRNRELTRDAELLRDRQSPLDQRLDPSPRRHRFAALEVDQLAREAVADRAPEVLLE